MALTYKSYQYYFTGTGSLLHDLVTCTTASCVVPSVYVTGDANATGIARLVLTKSGGTSVVLREWKIATNTEQETLQFLDGPLVLNTGDVLSASVSQRVFNYIVNYVESTTTAQTISTQDLSDWSLTPPTNGQIPTWNSATSQYEPTTSSAAINDTDDLSEGSTNLYYTNARADARIAAASIDDLSDVDTTTTAPITGQALVWDGSQWEPGTVSGGGGGATDLDGLSDVSAPTPTQGDVIVYNNAISTWVTSQSLQNLVALLKQPTSETTTIEADSSNKITIDKTASGEKVVATVDGTDAMVVKDTHTEFQGVQVQNEGRLVLREASANGTNYIGLKPPASVTTTTTFVLPDGDGTAGQFLKTDGSANLSFATPTGAVDSVNGQTGVVTLDSSDINRAAISPSTTIEDTLLEFDVVESWYDGFIPYYSLNTQPNANYNVMRIGNASGTSLTLSYLGSVSGAYAELRAGISFLRVNRNGVIQTDLFSLPSQTPQVNDTMIRETGTTTNQVIFSAPRSGMIHFEWRTNYFNLTNGVDNVIPFTDYYGTLGKTNFNEPYIGGSGIISVPTPGLYRVEMRVHLYDQTGGMDVTAGIYNQSTAQYIQKLIDVGPTTSGSTDRVYYGMGILQLLANNYQFVINPSTNSPYPSDTGNCYTSATLTWLGEP